MTASVTCYTCERSATTKEHVPPKCIFPSGSVGLITVPSCDKHNRNKTADDEYFRWIVAMQQGTNSAVVEPQIDTILRSFDRRPHIIETFLDKLKPVSINGGDTASIRLDVRRFERSVGAIVRGLFFHEFKTKLHARLTMVWGTMIFQNSLEAPFLKATMFLDRKMGPISRGANPKIFLYQFNESIEKKGTFGVCRLKFYEGLPICVYWAK